MQFFIFPLTCQGIAFDLIKSIPQQPVIKPLHLCCAFPTQDDEVGDGTTSVTVLASELLRQADKLIEMRIHPQTIAAGWRRYELGKIGMT